MCRSMATLVAAATLSMFVLPGGGPAHAQIAPGSPLAQQLNAPEHPVFGHMLMGGGGFIMTPHAYVPGHTTVYGGGTIFLVDDVNEEVGTFSRGQVGMGLGRFLEVGVTSLQDLDRYAAFAKVQLLQQHDAFPSLAMGVQNLTTVDSVGRYGLQDPTRTEQFRDVVSFYGVFTYVAGPGGADFPSWVVLSGGWGSGMFMKDLPPVNRDGRSGGLFGAAAVDFQAAENALIRVMLEHDGFDTNVGLTAYLAGLEVTAGILAVDEGERPEPLVTGEPFDPTRAGIGFIYNQAKPFMSVSLDARALGAFPWIWQ